jgi:16S rRNA (cytosine967-C5)-methyltransferase
VPGIALTALDLSTPRLARIEQSLARLGLKANLQQGDASRPEQWWDGTVFERILIDAPCSGSGVIRRHPDIKLLRTTQQVREAAALQLAILSALWPCLAQGGTLVYSTCSLLPEENEAVVHAFLASTPDARESPIDVDWGLARAHGRQLLPEAGGCDGFFYARLHKPA